MYCIISGIYEFPKRLKARLDRQSLARPGGKATKGIKARLDWWSLARPGGKKRFFPNSWPGMTKARPGCFLPK